MKKTLLLGLVVCSLLIVPIYSVVGAEETFVDPEDDVIDMMASEEEEVFTDQKPNIDITNVIYSRNGKDVTLSLEVKGEIEDRGDINDDDPDTLVSYSLVLYTNEQEYAITYVNKKCLLNEAEGGATYVKAGSIITFSFELENTDEIYAGLYVSSYDFVIKSIYDYDFEWYADDFEDVTEEIEVDVGGPYEGETGQSIQFYGDAQGGTEPYEWSWDFGDGDTSEEQNPTHAYGEAGEYYVTLIVIDDDEIAGYDEAIVTISAGVDDGDDGGDDGEDGDGSADGGSNGGSDGGSSSDLGVILFGAVIGIIVIIGIVVIVAIIRR